MDPRLSTERLTLRPFTPDDREWFVAVFADEEVTRHLGGPRDRAAATALLRSRVLQYYDEHPGLGIWMTLERDTRNPVGFHLLNHIQGETIVQIGYTLIRSASGRGYATEMAAAILRDGFDQWQLPRIAGIASLPNVASHRVLEKIGLRRNGERTFAHPAYASQGPMAWFERCAGDWRRERAGTP